MPYEIFKFDLSETFQQLASAPIVEAVIDFRARTMNAFQLDSLTENLRHKLADYQIASPINYLELHAQFQTQQNASAVEHQHSFLGLRLIKDDGAFVVEFTRDGVLFSQRKHYTHWEAFSTAAKLVWHVYRELAQPVEMERLGVRFINRLDAVNSQNLAEILREPPTCPSNLPLQEFVYQSTFQVPNRPYGIRMIKVMQPTMPGLIIDNDVFTTRAFGLEAAELDHALTDMHWLKNKIFFGILKPEAIQSFTESVRDDNITPRTVLRGNH